jgi:DNA-binding transcriptional MerR regulator
MTTPSRIRKLHPEQMTPQERLERLIELLANGVVRAARNKAFDSVEKINPISVKSIRSFQNKGRIPFGQCKTETGRGSNPTEIYWIAQIVRMSAEGLSSEQITQQLNQEDTRSQRAGRWSRTAVWRILQHLKQTGVTK